MVQILSLQIIPDNPTAVRKRSDVQITKELLFDKLTQQPMPNGLYDLKMGPINSKSTCTICKMSAADCCLHYGHIEYPMPIYDTCLLRELMKLIKGVCFGCHRLYDTMNLRDFLEELGYEEYANESGAKKELTFDERRIWVERCISELGKTHRGACKSCQSPSLVFRISERSALKSQLSYKKNRKNDTKPKKIKKSKSKRKNNDVTDQPLKKKMKLETGERQQLDKKGMIQRIETNYSCDTLDMIFSEKEIFVVPDILREHLRILWVNESEKIKLIFPFIIDYRGEYGTDVFFAENRIVMPNVLRFPLITKDSVIPDDQTTKLCDIMVELIKFENHLSKFQKKYEKIHLEFEKIETKDFNVIQEYLDKIQKLTNGCYDSNMCSIDKRNGLRQILDKKQGLFRFNIMGKRVNFACRSVISPDPTIGLDEVGVPQIFLKRLTFKEQLNPLNEKQLLQCIRNGVEKYPGAQRFEINGKMTGLSEFAEGRRKGFSRLLKYKMSIGHKVIIHRDALDGDYLVMNRQPTLHKPSMQAHRIRAITDDPNAKTLRMHYGNCKAYNADFDGDEMNGHYVQTIAAQIEAETIMGSCHQYATPKDGSPLAGLIQDHVIAGTKMCFRSTFFTPQQYYAKLKDALTSLSLSSIVSSNKPIILMKPAILKPKRLYTGKQLISSVIINTLPKNQEFYNILCDEGKKNELWMDQNNFKEYSLCVIDGYICTGLFDKDHVGPSNSGLITDIRTIYGDVVAINVLNSLARCLNSYLIDIMFSVSYEDALMTPEGEAIRDGILSDLPYKGYSLIMNTFNINSLNNDNPNLTFELLEKAQFEKSPNFQSKSQELELNWKKEAGPFTNELVKSCDKLMLRKFPHNSFSLMAKTGAKGGDSNIKKMAICIGQVEVEGKRCPLTISGKTLPSFPSYDFRPEARGFIKSCYSKGLTGEEMFFDSCAGRDGLVDTAVKTSSSGYLQRCLIKAMEDLSVAYDDTVRDSGNNVIQFKYGYDGLDVIKSRCLSTINNLQVFMRNLPLFKLEFKQELENRVEMIKAIKLPKYMKRNIKILKQQLTSKTERNLFVRIIKLRYLTAKVPYGEPVGLLAAQSIGEPSTQMTLNTFHNAGQSEMNVTLGIPRLKEILMGGLENIRTPTMSVKYLDEEIIKTVQHKFRQVTLNDVIEKPVILQRNQDGFYIMLNASKSKEFNQSFESVKLAVKKGFIDKLNKKIDICLKVKDVCEIKLSKKLAEDTQNDCGDGNDEKEGDDEKEESDDEKDVNDEGEENFDALSDINDGAEDTKEDEKIEDDVDKNAKEGVKIDVTNNKYVDSLRCKGEKFVIRIKKDVQLKFRLETTIEDMLNEVYVNKVDGIDNVILDKSSSQFTTQGYNFKALLKYSHVFDFDTFYTNNVIKIQKKYGIDAANKCIQMEIASVFKPYGISVDKRHLSLVADYLTKDGFVSAFNRHKMKNHPSAIQRTTFETALDSLHNMMVFGETDNMTSPSSSILFGQAPKLGTGSFKFVATKPEVKQPDMNYRL